LIIYLAASARRSAAHELFPPDFFSIDYNFDQCSTATHFALICPGIITRRVCGSHFTFQRRNAAFQSLDIGKQFRVFT